jgi:GntR family transcriptional regulator / MocR family aminotransferase
MRSTLLDSLVLDRRAAASLQQQLRTGFKGLIQRGALRGGQPLPSSRVLADDLSVSRNTVTAAYDQLVEEGFLESRVRSGLFVSAAFTAPITRVRRRAPSPSAEPAPPVLAPPRPFRPCQPDVRLFPLALWNRLRGRVLRRSGLDLLHYQSQCVLGHPALRQAIASYLHDSRGVQCDWGQVAVTAGSQQALFLLAQLLVDPSATVAMEDPGYLGAQRAWQQRGATVVPLSVDALGLPPPTALGEGRPVLVYTTPSRQFPTGACLPMARRLAWLEFARAANAWIVEDDYDSEFRYGRPTVPSLHSLDTAGRVIYVGSMSKVLVPSLRIGYVVLPPPLVDRFAALRSIVDDHGPLIDQAVMAEFIDGGMFYSHIRRCRREYGERRQVFLDTAARAGLPLTLAQSDGGMNVLGWLPRRSRDERLSQALRPAGFDVPSLSSYSLSRCPPGLVLGYAAFDPKALRTQVVSLARTLDRELAAG